MLRLSVRTQKVPSRVPVVSHVRRPQGVNLAVDFWLINNGFDVVMKTSYSSKLEAIIRSQNTFLSPQAPSTQIPGETSSCEESNSHKVAQESL